MDDRRSPRALVRLLVAWGLLMAASAAPFLLGSSTGSAGGAVNPWLPFLACQVVAFVPAVACWVLALRRRPDLPPGLFLLAVLPIGWGLLVALAVAFLTYLAS